MAEPLALRRAEPVATAVGRSRLRPAAMVRHAVLIGAVVIMVFPVAWAMRTSLLDPGDIYRLDLLPPSVTLDNYRDVFANFPLARPLRNTLVMAAGVTAGQVGLAVLAAYALVRFPCRGRRLILALLTTALLIPPQALIVPQFLAVARLGWLGTDVGLIVPQLGGCALAVLLLRQHIGAIPPSLFEAASLDGARPRDVLRHIVVPVLRPAIGAVSVLVFITTWNEYLWPLLVAPDPEDTTVQLGLSAFRTQEGSQYGALLAAATVTTLPILAVYLVASRRITDAFLQAGLR